MNKKEIMEATLVSFEGSFGDTKLFTVCSEKKSTVPVQFTVMKTINCVVDSENNKAIDLETGKVYHIMQRDEIGNILYDELVILKNEKVVVAFYYEKDLSEMSQLYKLFLENRAREIYNRYKGKNSPKVKKIGTKKKN